MAVVGGTKKSTTITTIKEDNSMTALRTKTTAIRVATALEKLQGVRDELQGIDLRTTRGTLRDEIREARSSVELALERCTTALQADAEQLARRHAS